jgi:hypothetical protein
LFPAFLGLLFCSLGCVPPVLSAPMMVCLFVVSLCLHFALLFLPTYVFYRRHPRDAGGRKPNLWYDYSNPERARWLFRLGMGYLLLPIPLAFSPLWHGVGGPLIAALVAAGLYLLQALVRGLSALFHRAFP